MTTYYAKPLEVLNPAIYDVNPATFNNSFASRCGNLPLTLKDPWKDKYVHYDGIINAVKMRAGDSPGWEANGDNVPDPGKRKLKWFWWNYKIDEATYHSIKDNPEGMVAQQVRSGLQAQQDFFKAQVDVWLAGYLYSTSTDDYDKEWIPHAALSSASTVSDPNDACAAAGTATDLTASILSGTAVTVDAINTSIGAAKQQFYQQYDSNTHQSMFKQNGNTFDLFLHPAVVEKLNRGHLSDASGALDYTQTVKEALAKEVNIVPTYAFDAAYDGASNTEAQAGLTMNTTENCQILEAIPYTVEPWVLRADDHYHIRAYWKIGAMTRPFRIGAYWKKATQVIRLIPYKNA